MKNPHGKISIQIVLGCRCAFSINESICGRRTKPHHATARIHTAEDRATGPHLRESFCAIFLVRAPNRPHGNTFFGKLHRTLLIGQIHERFSR